MLFQKHTDVTTYDNCPFVLIDNSASTSLVFNHKNHDLKKYETSNRPECPYALWHFVFDIAQEKVFF